MVCVSCWVIDSLEAVPIGQQFLLNETQTLNSDWQCGGSICREKGNQTVDYLVVIGTLLLVAAYAVVVGWLLPKH